MKLLLFEGFSNDDLLLSVSLQLVRRIYKGIPLQLRGEVWCMLLDVPKIKEEKKDFYEVRSQDLTLQSCSVSAAQQPSLQHKPHKDSQASRRAPWLYLISLSFRIIVGKVWVWRLDCVCVKLHSSFLHAVTVFVLQRDKLCSSLESLAARINISLLSVAVWRYYNYEVRAYAVTEKTNSGKKKRWERNVLSGEQGSRVDN